MRILITGPVASGKTTLASLLASAIDYPHLNISKIASDSNSISSFDEELNSLVIDDELLLDHLDPLPENCIIDYHSPSLFPESWIDLIVCLTCDNQVVYDRLKKRGYSDVKINVNVDVVIMKIVEEECFESYDREIVHVKQSDSLEDMEANLEFLVDFVGFMI